MSSFLKFCCQGPQFTGIHNYGKWQGSALASPLIQEIVCYLSSALKSCSGLCNTKKNLWFSAIIWNTCFEVLEACYGTQFLSFYLDLPLKAIDAVCLQFGLPSIDPHLIPCAGLSRFQLREWLIYWLIDWLIDWLVGWMIDVPAPPQLEHLCHRKSQIGNTSAVFANLYIMFFQSIRHDPFEKNVEEGGWQKTSLPYSDCCSEQFSHAAVHLDCTCSLVVQVLKGAI